MMLERRLHVLVRDGQRDPRLDAVHRLAGRALFVGRALRMDDAAAGGHPVDIAGDDLLHGAEAVAMHDRAVEQIGDGREPDMRMRAHVESRAGHERCGTDVVEEDERADGSHGSRRQHAPHRETADVVLMRLKKRFDC